MRAQDFGQLGENLKDYTSPSGAVLYDFIGDFVETDFVVLNNASVIAFAAFVFF